MFYFEQHRYYNKNQEMQYVETIHRREHFMGTRYGRSLRRRRSGHVGHLVDHRASYVACHVSKQRVVSPEITRSLYQFEII
jgi:hypothetical protein